ncbi:hypothetical protein EW145_g2284 [Phellinidium pouzarii]|uniref:WKF domain-containing protein n=1 Tax=Phellinidium pouzarii TaxID=167371 RepID=A0A4V6S194_9AGAM|nr:hypothetical protein EW145_g2284 [Phellinidium pouzarii]
MGTQLEPTPSRKEKKKKPKEQRATSSEADVEDKKSKKKGKEASNQQKPSDDVMEDVETSEHKERKRKRKHSEVDAENGVQGEEKHSANDIVSQEDTQAVKKKKDKGKSNKKKHKKDRNEKNAISFQPNPSEDTELSDKARGALSYACARLSSPDSWKFNKAYQNWIVKHIFSIDDISEKYSPIVTAYLSGCQGGVRENLINICNKQLDLNIESADSNSDVPTAGPLKEDGGVDSEIKVLEQESVASSLDVQKAIKTRARAILEALDV